MEEGEELDVCVVGTSISCHGVCTCDQQSTNKTHVLVDHLIDVRPAHTCNGFDMDIHQNRPVLGHGSIPISCSCCAPLQRISVLCRPQVSPGFCRHAQEKVLMGVRVSYVYSHSLELASSFPGAICKVAITLGFADFGTSESHSAEQKIPKLPFWASASSAEFCVPKIHNHSGQT